MELTYLQGNQMKILDCSVRLMLHEVCVSSLNKCNPMQYSSIPESDSSCVSISNSSACASDMESPLYEHHTMTYWDDFSSLSEACRHWSMADLKLMSDGGHFAIPRLYSTFPVLPLLYQEALHYLNIYFTYSLSSAWMPSWRYRINKGIVIRWITHRPWKISANNMYIPDSSNSQVTIGP